MQADLYLEGAFWASVIIPPHSPITLLAQALASHLNDPRELVGKQALSPDDIHCTISLSVKIPPPSKLDSKETIP